MNARQRRKIRQRKTRFIEERIDGYLALCRLRGEKPPNRERLMKHLQAGGTFQNYTHYSQILSHLKGFFMARDYYRNVSSLHRAIKTGLA